MYCDFGWGEDKGRRRREEPKKKTSTRVVYSLKHSCFSLSCDVGCKKRSLAEKRKKNNNNANM